MSRHMFNVFHGFPLTVSIWPPEAPTPPLPNMLPPLPTSKNNHKASDIRNCARDAVINGRNLTNKYRGRGARAACSACGLWLARGHIRSCTTFSSEVEGLAETSESPLQKHMRIKDIVIACDSHDDTKSKKSVGNK